MANLLQGDCLLKLKELADNSVDSIVTDPPYGLSFMGKKWDYDVPTTAIWAECLRVLKPGGHLLAFFGTRTYHRGVVRIEDAGFEIRDQIQWIYGSGFPKSHDISKAIDKQAGAEREVVGEKTKPFTATGRNNGRALNKGLAESVNKDGYLVEPITAPSTDSAKQWQGWGTALKPANEPIVVARKPLEKGLTVAQNVLKWGTGALNIDGSRIGMSDADRAAYIEKRKSFGNSPVGEGWKNSSENLSVEQYIQNSSQGRWPANVIFDEEAAAMLDEQTGELGKSTGGRIHSGATGKSGIYGTDKRITKGDPGFGDSGGASRFFYVAKASKRERGEGNTHPTVKPTKLGVYLQTLVTPPGGVTLDPFMGSGSFGVSAKMAGFQFIGIELNEEYFTIAQKRIG